MTGPFVLWFKGFKASILPRQLGKLLPVCIFVTLNRSKLIIFDYIFFLNFFNYNILENQCSLLFKDISFKNDCQRNENNLKDRS